MGDAEYPTEMARYIFEDLFPQWKKSFLEKNAGYGEYDGELGDKGEFVEIRRKTNKLQRGIWDGEDIGPEGIDEVLMDMIGHCFLALGVRNRTIWTKDLSRKTDG
jgi:hypothetical protein